MVSLTEEQKEFLLQGTRTAKLATVRKDGRPHVAPVWFQLDGDVLIFTTGADTVKGANIQRDGRVSICVDDEAPPFSYILVEGIATVETDSAALLDWAIQIAGRYMGSERAEEYGKRNGVPGELLIRVAPRKVIFAKNVAD